MLRQVSTLNTASSVTISNRNIFGNNLTTMNLDVSAKVLVQAKKVPRNSVSHGLKRLFHLVWRFTCGYKKRGKLHKSGVRGTPPKRRPQQKLNHNWWQQDCLPRGFCNPNRFPRTFQYHHKQCPLPPWREVFLIWHKKLLSCHPDRQIRIFQNQYW